MTTQEDSAQFLLKAVDGTEQLPIDRELRMGRDAASDVILDQGGASRRHAVLKPGDEGVWVEDSGSTNGTFVNGERIEQPRLLRDGDELRAGEARFMLEVIVPAAEPDPDATQLMGGGPDPDATALHSPEPEPSPEKAAPEPSAGEAPPEAPTPPREKPEAGASEQKPAEPEPEAPDSKAPPSWVLDNQQSVDGTALFSKDLLKDSLRHSENNIAPQQEVNDPTLIGNSDPVMGLRFQLIGEDKHQWEVGRSPNADVMLNHESVSGAHAQIIHEAGRWKLVDLMSANGTYANGKKCLTGYLSSGDIVCFGSVECVFALPEPEPEEEPEPEPEPEVVHGSAIKIAAIAFVATAAVAGTVLFIISLFL